MRFKKWDRHPFTDTPRKRAALRRKQQRERDALTLFAAEIAEAQPGEDAVMEARAVAWAKQEARDRDRRAQNWRSARRRLAALSHNEQAVLRQAWNRAPYPADPVYLHDFLHAYAVGRITLAALPFAPVPRDPIGRRLSEPEKQGEPHA